MSELVLTKDSPTAKLIQETIRIRADQKKRLKDECQAKGGTVADALRDNLDLAFAMKSELANIAVGEFNENDPNKTTMFVNSLLFRVEERILNAFDDFTKKMVDGPKPSLNDQPQITAKELVEKFVDLIVDETEYSTSVWVGAFLELVPRISLISSDQLAELERKGDSWISGI